MNKRYFALMVWLLHAIVLLSIFGRSTMAGSMPLAERVPDDAIIYVGWAGADAQLGAYRNSDLSALIEHSNLPDVAKNYLPKLWMQLASHTDHQVQAEALRNAFGLLWHHPVAIYVSNLSIRPDGTPDGDVSLICDAGLDVAELMGDLASAVNGNSHLHLVAKDSIVTLSVKDSPTAVPTSNLTGNAGFNRIMQKLQASPALAIYVDGSAILNKFGESASKDQNAAEIWPKVKDALGIAGIKSYGMTAGFDRGHWSTESVLEAPAPRTGLLSVIEPRPIDPVLLAHIPASAGAVSVINFDAAGLFDTIQAVMAVRKESDDAFHQATGGATLVLGRNLRRQILATLGPQWVVYSDAANHGPVILNHPVKPDDAGDALVSATFGLVNLANAQLATAQPVANAVQTTVKGLDITSAVTSMASPSFAIKNGLLYAGISPDSVISAANFSPATGARNVLQGDSFASIAKELAGQLGSFSYCDLPSTARGANENLPKAIDQIRKGLSLTGIDLPAVEFPPIEQWLPHLSPALSTTWADDAGLYSRSVSPFPASRYLLGDPQQMMLSATALSQLTQLLVPLVDRVRQQAAYVSEMTQERKLVMALHQYRTTHHGQFPTNLGDVIIEGDISRSQLSLFLRPGSNVKVPAEIVNGDRHQQADWVNSNASYKYIAPDPKLSSEQAASTAMLVPKDLQAYTRKIPVGFVDGHCEGCTAERVQQLLHPDAVPAD